jgi:sialate O-acetylesterase
MIAPLAPMSLTGVIWYQGEANAERGEQYRQLLPAMIGDWRRAFGQGDFPFYIVSLAAFMPHRDQPGGPSGWAEFRDAQAYVARTVKNSSLALAIDKGDAGDIHPRDKREVGERLALCALAGHYGKDLPHSGPVFRSSEPLPSGDALRITFDHADGGLIAPGEALEEFSIAGDDLKWAWATARIDGNSVIVTSPAVSRPKFVRYAWQSNPRATLYNRAGLPAVPFRTDGVSGGK